MKTRYAWLLAALFSVPAAAGEPGDCIAMIGTGSVGGALGPRFASLGERIVYGSRTPGEERVQNLVARTGERASAMAPDAAARACWTIVLAVPWSAVETTVKSFGNLDGRLIVDVTNPLGVRDGVEVEAPLQAPSMGEFVQSLAPGAKVVKAFNTIFAEVLRNGGRAAGRPATVFVASDDADARATVAKLAESAGFETLETGALATARYLEPAAALNITLGYGLGLGTDIAPTWQRAA